MFKLDRIKKAFRQRPVRVLEAVVTLVAGLGIVIDPDLAEAAITLVTLVIGGGEFAQTKTYSRDYVDKANPS